MSLLERCPHFLTLHFPQDDRKRGTRDGILHDKRTKRKKLQSISVRKYFCKNRPKISHNFALQKIIDTDMIRRQRQEELLRIQEQRAIEKVTKGAPPIIVLMNRTLAAPCVYFSTPEVRNKIPLYILYIF